METSVETKPRIRIQKSSNQTLKVDTPTTSTSRTRKTYSWHEIPEWQQDNHYILSGYVRQTSSFVKSFKSLGYIHNETVNIYSHLIPSIFSLLLLAVALYSIVPEYSTTTWHDHFVIAIFLSGVVICLGLSSTFHCLKSHSNKIMVFGNKLDYLGIVVLIVASMVGMIYYGLMEHPFLRLLLWSIIALLGTGCAVVSLKQKFRSPEYRPIRASMFIIFGLSGVLPVLTGIYLYGVSECWNRVQLQWILLEAFLYISGAVIYALRVPERFSPGSFDLWGHSHQIFHILVVFAAISHGKGLLDAYSYSHHHVIPILQHS